MKVNSILLVDDLDIVLEPTANFLKRKFDVFTASNGIEAWDILESRKIDCLITDVNMPVMDGIELLKKMKGNDYKIKTIVVSGAYDLTDKKSFSGLEVDEYIAKPYLPNDLIRAINTLLES